MPLSPLQSCSDWKKWIQHPRKHRNWHQDHLNRQNTCISSVKRIFGTPVWRPSWKMAAILDFQVANRVDFINVPMGLTVPNLVLVSQFAQFCHNIDVIRSTTYLVRQWQHTIYCAMGPKSFSAVMARKTTSGAEWKTHQKQYISGASGGFFQVVEMVQKLIYFKFVISGFHCQQLGLYSKCYTVCDFTIHWSHSKCPEVKTAKPLLSVVRTGKPNWRGVQLFRRTNRKMTNMLNNCNCSLFSLCNLCHSISPVIRLPLENNCNRTFLIFSIFSLINFNILHKLKMYFWRILVFKRLTLL